jgi:hydroxypyruvate isomerase
MAGLLPHESARAEHRATYIENLRYAAAETARSGVGILIEAINTRDIPGFFLNTQADAHVIRQEVGSDNLKVQMDLYHTQIVEGDIATKLQRYLPDVGHIQIAGVPGRHEPDDGEVNYPYLFDLLDELGYSGWVGCEYRPRRGTVEGLGWLRRAKAYPSATAQQQIGARTIVP